MALVGRKVDYANTKVNKIDNNILWNDIGKLKHPVCGETLLAS